MNNLNQSSNTIILGDWSFNIININDIGLYSSYIKNTDYPANLWTTNFAFLWAVSQSQSRKTLWKIVDDMLVTFGLFGDDWLYLVGLPYGHGDPDKVVSVILKCLNYCVKFNNCEEYKPGLKVVNSMQLEFLKKSNDFKKYFRAIPLVGLEKHFSVQKLVTLKGKEFETLRRKINKLKRLYPSIAVRNYKPEDYEEAMKLGEYWNNKSGQKYSVIFDKVYFKEIVKHYNELNHTILVVEIDNKMAGLVTGGPLPTGQSWWCISKFINDFDGLSEFLVVEIAKAINQIDPKIELMNAGEDLGPGGLRQFKEMFRPALDLRRYIIKLRD